MVFSGKLLKDRLGPQGPSGKTLEKQYAEILKQIETFNIRLIHAVLTLLHFQ